MIRFMIFITSKACVNIIRVFISLLPFFFSENIKNQMSISELINTLPP